MSEISRAVEQTPGGQAGLAKILGIRPQAISQWVSKGRAPANRCLAIEEATGGKVTRYELRPDVFGPATSVSSDSLGAAAENPGRHRGPAVQGEAAETDDSSVGPLTTQRAA